MIDHDTTHLPVGANQWSQFLEAALAADEHDESEWIEFKALPDMTDKRGGAHVAKAITAFANREPERAARWIDGCGLLVIGIEPGNITGTARRDPADIDNAVRPLLTPPAPAWDVLPMEFRGHHVIIVIVAAPRAGDPIACIAKAAGNTVEDGQIFVRRPGKSEPAKSADVRRLSERLVRGLVRTLDLEVIAEVDGGLRRPTWSESWIDDWLEEERSRLIGPLERQPHSPLFGGVLERHARIASTAQMANPFADHEEPEDRDPDDYRAEVEAYLTVCREQLAEAVPNAQARALKPVRWRARNLTHDNLKRVQVRVHVLGDVSAYERQRSFTLRDHHPRPPRIWGPRTVRGIASGMERRLLATRPALDAVYASNQSSGPVIKNGGSAWIEFDPVHLRPGREIELRGGFVLAVGGNHGGDVQCEWSATATNVSGHADGLLTIPIAHEPLDINPLLQWTDDSGPRVIHADGRDKWETETTFYEED